MNKNTTLLISGILLISAVLSVGCQNLYPPEQTSLQSKEEMEAASKAADEAVVPTPKAAIPSETLYSLLVAEIAGQRDRYDISLGHYMQEAHRTRDPAIAARAARIAQYLGASQASLEATLLWIDIDPDNVAAHQSAAIELIRQGHFEDATLHMERVLELGGEANFKFIVLNAEPLSYEERESLINTYSELVLRHPDNTKVVMSKAILLQQNEHFEAALIETERAISLDKKNTTALVIKARLLLQLDETDKALKHLKKSINANPDHKNIRLLYARLLVDDNQLDEAQQQFSILVDQSPNDGDLIYSLALVAIENNLLVEAEQYLLQLLNLNQHVEEAHFYLGRIAEQQEDWNKAIYHFQNVADGPDFLHAQVRLTQIWVEQDQTDHARSYIQQSRDNHPDKIVQLYLLESDLLQRLDEASESRSILDEAIAQFPDEISLLNARSTLAERQNDLVQVEADLRKVLSLDPNNTSALNALGYTLANKTDRYHEAFPLIKKALELKPDDPAIIDSMGWIHYRLGNYDQALAYLEKALEKQPDHEIAAHLGEVLWVVGEETQARHIWNNALQQTPDSPILLEVLKRFDIEL